MLDPGIWAIGFGIGFLVGLTGMGGGALMTPVLILFTGTPPLTAVGTDLFSSSITKAAGALQHFRQRTVHLPLVFFLALGSLPGGFLGVWIIKLLQDFYHLDMDVYVSHALGAMLILVAAILLLRVLWSFRNGNGHYEEPSLKPRGKLLLAVFGFIIGLLVGLTSVGSGTLVVVALTVCFRLQASRIVGTDVFHGAFLVGVAGLTHLSLGNVDLPLAGGLLIGSVPGVLLGSRLTLKVPETALRGGIAAMLLFSGIRLIP